MSDFRVTAPAAALRFRANVDPMCVGIEGLYGRVASCGLQPLFTHSQHSILQIVLRGVLPTLSDQQIRLLVNYKPKRKCQKRLHLLVLFLLDTGCRITEALTLRVSEIDMQNMLVTLEGKGRKQRIVPFSLELRKALFRYIKESGRKSESLLFANRSDTRLGRRNILRDVKLLCKRLGFAPPVRTLHAFRHTFAVNYLRRGGSVFHLQKVLGHSTLEMTRRYANLVTADLQAVHERVSLLSASR
jgi:integrase/recombinase XerD